MSTHDCTRTSHAAALFLAGDLPAQEVNLLRAHRARCSECDATWRHSLQAAASMQHRGRSQRKQAQTEVRRASHRRLALAGMLAGGLSRKRRRLQLRLIALPTLAVVLMTVIYPLGSARRARLEVLAGPVELGAQSLASGASPLSLARGDQCKTGLAGRARIACRAAAIELEGDTLVLVENEGQGRFRLDSGSLRVEGDCTVTSRFGLVEVRAGKAELRVDPQGLQVQALEGRVATFSSLGERRVPPGTGAVLRHP